VYKRSSIAAVATPPGSGGVGIIRVSGDNAFLLAKDLFRPKSKVKNLIPTKMYYGDIIDVQGDLVDSGYFVWFEKPRSFTGENVVEFHCHGGMIILQTLLKALYALGVHPAEPGEFSKRAFLNGQMDLAQAEAIADLIDAESTKAAEIARGHLRGQLSRRIEGIRENIAGVLAWMEAEIDYPDTDIDSTGREQSLSQIDEQLKALAKLKNTYQEGKVYREGVVTVILGRPNVGKSSLLNTLAGEERAIVTDVPGTTRDVVEVPVNIRGIPLRLADTAGIRESLDKVEQIGIERARQLAAQAQLTLLLIDSSNPLEEEDSLLLQAANRSNTIVILNKADLPAKVEDADIRALNFQHVHSVSALEERGIEELKDSIEAMFTSGQFQQDTTFVTNQRHASILEQAFSQLVRAIQNWNELPLDILAMDLRDAWQGLGEITGAVWSEDLLDCIFANFCLGK